MSFWQHVTIAVAHRLAHRLWISGQWQGPAVVYSCFSCLSVCLSV